MDIEADGRVAAGMAVEEESGYRIVSVSAPGMAAENATDCQVQPLERAVLAESLKRILRACGGEAAGRLLERRDADLIEADQQHEREYCSLPEDALEIILPRFHLQPPFPTNRILN